MEQLRDQQSFFLGYEIRSSWSGWDCWQLRMFDFESERALQEAMRLRLGRTFG